MTYYDVGRTPFFAAKADTRFSYCLYVPEDYAEDGTDRYDVVVLVHGTERGAQTYRDRFANFAERERVIVLAPLFPANTFGAGDLDNYKQIEHGGVRYDRVLLGMVDEVAEKYRLRDDRFVIHGFSGGGHFVHRFFYLHPRRVRGLSVGAPGVVTLLDTARDWWVGVGDLERRFGVSLDVAGMREAAVQMVVGANDVETWEITLPKSSSWWMEGAEIANGDGMNRLDRIAALKRSWEDAEIRVRLDRVPGVAHDGSLVLGPVMDFFTEVLAATR